MVGNSLHGLLVGRGRVEVGEVTNVEEVTVGQVEPCTRLATVHGLATRVYARHMKVEAILDRLKDDVHP